ncbi:MAG TPA: CtsR family transcriptional regulator [Candidatus Atopostipes pullistercoris]|uniref:Transcriptional regulator CtsR n=1 Tax=Candidatus Atopostipes pullistercoris TaxID=2838467 RepID=A0A9D2G159_9LACT|nr:CtsR family transcriptional regulator [Candidatus Atopostipes pullistercoris]
MRNKSMSDLIEEYLKKVLQEEGKIEIQRNEIAEIFDCVPSQINYVINTRFTMQHGYDVESKRGGGGYIRIVKVQVNNNIDLLDHMSQIIGNHISEKEAQVIIDTLYDNELMTNREAQIMLAAIEQQNYSGNPLIDNQIRANILLSMIELLILKNK